MSTELLAVFFPKNAFSGFCVFVFHHFCWLLFEHCDPADQDAAHMSVGYGSHTYDVG